MNKRHKWYKEICAWADGEIIEYRWIPSMHTSSNWSSVGQNELDWNLATLEFRIKPKPKEPQYLYVYGDDTGSAKIDLIKMDTRYGQPYIGKIKLQVDDE